MDHPIHRVVAFEIVGDYTLGVPFESGIRRVIDFAPILATDLLGPLRDLSLFRQVRLDPEAHALVWSNGADFEPATLHEWPQCADEFAARVKGWEPARA